MTPTTKPTTITVAAAAAAAATTTTTTTNICTNIYVIIEHTLFFVVFKVFLLQKLDLSL